MSIAGTPGLILLSSNAYLLHAECTLSLSSLSTTLVAAARSSVRCTQLKQGRRANAARDAALATYVQLRCLYGDRPAPTPLLFIAAQTKWKPIRLILFFVFCSLLLVFSSPLTRLIFTTGKQGKTKKPRGRGAGRGTPAGIACHDVQQFAWGK